MSIQVTCPGCMSRFTVDDKYAGRKGPCPKCKKEIVIPDKSQQVVIHAPAESGPKDSKGVSVLKPIKRREFKVGRWTWIAAGVGSLLVLIIAICVRWYATTPPTSLLALGCILLAPPIVMAAYAFLQDEELEGYTGQEYLIRVAICSAVFAATWLLYVGLGYYFDSKTMADIPSMQMAIYLVIMIAVGTVASLATLELETLPAAGHYISYLAVCIFLCLIMGVELGEPLAKPKAKTTTRTVTATP